MLISEVKEVVIPKNTRMSKDSLLTIVGAWQQRGLAGQLNWTSNQTHPTVSFGACELSTSIKDVQICELVSLSIKYIFFRNVNG